MTDREKEILNAINEMGLFRTPYPNDEVSRLVSKLIKDKIEELEKIRAEIEQTYINITYQENKDRQASWGLRKALEIIDKYKEELKGEDNQKPIKRTKYIDGDLLFSKIAGHSDYHGDNILSAISCLQEGKEISTISAIGDNE